MDPHSALELTHAAAAAAAVTRLVQLNLAGKFRALFAYLAFIAAINVIFGVTSNDTAFYFWTYLVVEPLKCVFSIFAVRELLTLVFERYPGIRSLGRWVMNGGVALFTSLSVLLTKAFWSSSAAGRAHSHLFYFELVQRTVVFTLALVIITVLLFLSRYPLHLGRNTIVSSVFFSVLFLSESVQLMIDTLFLRLNNLEVDLTESGFITLCLVGWAFMLKPGPEMLPAKVRFSTPHEDHLLAQLNAINQLMTRSAKR
jgi:hypothetical protein